MPEKWPITLRDIDPSFRLTHVVAVHPAHEDCAYYLGATLCEADAFRLRKEYRQAYPHARIDIMAAYPVLIHGAAKEWRDLNEREGTPHA
jgi:hypothetical protein